MRFSFTYDSVHHLHHRKRDWFAKPARFDFEELVRELQQTRSHDAALSAAEIRRGWDRVARYAASLGEGEADAAHGMLRLGAGDLLRLSPGGGHGFGFDASIGAGRRHEEFSFLEGLREGFRRL